MLQRSRDRIAGIAHLDPGMRGKQGGGRPAQRGEQRLALGRLGVAEGSPHHDHAQPAALAHVSGRAVDRRLAEPAHLRLEPIESGPVAFFQIDEEGVLRRSQRTDRFQRLMQIGHGGVQVPMLPDEAAHRQVVVVHLADQVGG